MESAQGQGPCCLRVCPMQRNTFHAKMGIKDRNGMDLTEAEDIKERWQEYTEELYKKDLHNPDNHNVCDHSP